MARFHRFFQAHIYCAYEGENQAAGFLQGAHGLVSGLQNTELQHILCTAGVAHVSRYLCMAHLEAVNMPAGTYFAHKYYFRFATLYDESLNDLFAVA